MSIILNDVDYFQYFGGLIAIGTGTEAVQTQIDLINLSTVATTYSEALLADDPNGDGRLNLGETFTLTTAGEPVLLTMTGAGTYSALLTSTRTVIIGEDELGTQYIVFPNGDAPVLVGTVAATTTIFAAGYDPGAGTVICFAAGTRIETARGMVRVEHLQIGDLIRTQDHGFKPLLWIGGRRLSAAELALYPKHRPIRIRKGALGAGIPQADLLVSPQHRVLVRSQVVQRMFGQNEVLIGAIHLTAIDGIEPALDMAEVTYWHFLLDCHEIVFSNGAATESLFTGPQAMASVSAESRAEILRLFPDLGRPDPQGLKPARDLVKGRPARNFADRLMKNGKPAVIAAPQPEPIFA